jgi:hypothetical protein
VYSRNETFGKKILKNFQTEKMHKKKNKQTKKQTNKQTNKQTFGVV